MDLQGSKIMTMMMTMLIHKQQLLKAVHVHRMLQLMKMVVKVKVMVDGANSAAFQCCTLFHHRSVTRESTAAAADQSLQSEPVAVVVAAAPLSANGRRTRNATKDFQVGCSSLKTMQMMDLQARLEMTVIEETQVRRST
jgi:hypothetical protein